MGQERRDVSIVYGPQRHHATPEYDPGVDAQDKAEEKIAQINRRKGSWKGPRANLFGKALNFGSSMVKTTGSFSDDPTWFTSLRSTSS